MKSPTIQPNAHCGKGGLQIAVKPITRFMTKPGYFESTRHIYK